MALLGYKPRPRMRSWAAPEPPPPRRSGYLLIALLGWFGALYVGYRWVWPGTSPFRNDETALESEQSENNEGTPEPATLTRYEAPQTVVPVNPSASDTERARDETAAAPKPSNGELPGCEGFRAEIVDSDNERMPAHLGMAAIGSFIGESAWLKPCRGHKRRSMRFCAAIRNGSLLGLTLRAEPPDLTLENCVREQALKVPLRAEPSLRIIETRLSL